MSSAYIKELDKHILFSHIEVFTVVNPDLIPVGTLRKIWGIPQSAKIRQDFTRHRGY